jgi:hypothetical protein
VNHRQSETQLFESIEPSIDVRDHRLAARGVRDDRLGGRFVRGQEALANLWIPLAGRCRARGVDERVGHPAHCRCDHGDAVPALERRNNE